MKLTRLVLACFLLALPAACQPANKPPANEAAPDPDARIQATQRVPQTAPRPGKEQSGQATAQRLAHLAAQVPQVNDATAVVIGKTAVVGIDVDASLDHSRVDTIKYSVAEALREDPQGANAIVTADVDIVQRLREMNQEIRNGRPVSAFADELAEIVGRIMPQFPKQVERREEPAEGPNQQRMNQTPRAKEGGNDDIQPAR
ncbi:hypothetical protein BSNK01_15200 [Bacillaceae bacterium]